MLRPRLFNWDGGVADRLETRYSPRVLFQLWFFSFSFSYSCDFSVTVTVTVIVFSVSISISVSYFA